MPKFVPVMYPSLPVYFDEFPRAESRLRSLSLSIYLGHDMISSYCFILFACSCRLDAHMAVNEVIKEFEFDVCVFFLFSLYSGNLAPT